MGQAEVERGDHPLAKSLNPSREPKAFMLTEVAQPSANFPGHEERMRYFCKLAAEGKPLFSGRRVDFPLAERDRKK